MLNDYPNRQQLLDRIEQLEELLGIDDVSIADTMHALTVTKTEAKVIGFLYRRELMSRDALFAVLYGDREDGIFANKLLDQWIFRARRGLRPHDIEIETIWGVGYRMTAPNKAKLRQLLGHQQ